MEELALLHRQIGGGFSRLAAFSAISAGGESDDHSHALHGLPPCPGLLMILPLGRLLYLSRSLPIDLFQ
jgi:hypothetical protein